MIIWFANILTKLNGFAAKIRHAEETRPGERSLWSKIKSAVAKVIVWVTNKIEHFVRPDKIGDEYNDNDTSLHNKDVNNMITFSKENRCLYNWRSIRCWSSSWNINGSYWSS